MNVFSLGIFIVFFNISSSQFTEMNNRGDIMVEFIEYTCNIETQLKSVFIIKNWRVDLFIYITFE
jgi:hypothetical protein